MRDQVRGERSQELFGVAALDHQLLALVDRDTAQLERGRVGAVLDVALVLRLRCTGSLGRLARPVMFLGAGPAAERIARFQRHRRKGRAAD